MFVLLALHKMLTLPNQHKH